MFFAVKCQHNSLLSPTSFMKSCAERRCWFQDISGNVDQTFYARSDFDECTVVSHNNHFDFHLVTNLQVISSIPWVRSQLFRRERYVSFFVIEVKDNNVEFLIQLNPLLFGSPTRPQERSVMWDQTVYATTRVGMNTP